MLAVIRVLIVVICFLITDNLALPVFQCPAGHTAEARVAIGTTFVAAIDFPLAAFHFVQSETVFAFGLDEVALLGCNALVIIARKTMSNCVLRALDTSLCFR